MAATSGRLYFMPKTTATPPKGYRTQADDTSYEVERRLVEAWRQMSAADKARRVTQAFLALEALAVAGIRARHPAADTPEIRLRLAALRLGRDATVAAFGWDPAVHGY